MYSVEYCTNELLQQSQALSWYPGTCYRALLGRVKDMLQEQAAVQELFDIRLGLPTLTLPHRRVPLSIRRTDEDRAAAPRVPKHRRGLVAGLGRREPLAAISPVLVELAQEMRPSRFREEKRVYGAPCAVERALDPGVPCADRFTRKVEPLAPCGTCERLVHVVELAGPEERECACRGLDELLEADTNRERRTHRARIMRPAPCVRLQEKSAEELDVEVVDPRQFARDELL